MNLSFHIDLKGARSAKLTADPARDWLVLLALALAALAAIVLANVLIYQAAVSGTLLANAPASAPAYDSALVGEVSNVFAARASAVVEYENGAHSFVDPSP